MGPTVPKSQMTRAMQGYPLLKHNIHIGVSLVREHLMLKSVTRVVQGYPGAVVASVAYTLDGSNLQITMRGIIMSPLLT